MNLRICLNMNDNMLEEMNDSKDALFRIINLCKRLKADQITCRALWTSADGTPQAEWIRSNVTKKTYDFIKTFKEAVEKDGRYRILLNMALTGMSIRGFR